MNRDIYFDIDPWTYLCGLVKSGSLTDIKLISVQCTCVSGKSEDTYREWKFRLADLFSEPIRIDEMIFEKVISAIIAYPGNRIARIFIDDSAEEQIENIELVTTNQLIVWKPNVHPLIIINRQTRY